MPDIRPFRGLRYDPHTVPDLSAVLCPPYDVIDPDQRAQLAAGDLHNAVHVELPVAGPGTDSSPYANAARLFAAWQADGTVRRDDRPLIYIVGHRYRSVEGSERLARGFFCRLKLEPLDPASGVRAHERTMAAPKEDRYRLLGAVEANLSPIELLYEDGAGGASSTLLLDRLTRRPPDREATDDAGVHHGLWLADPAASPDAAALLALAGRAPLTIADGHHRYETALRYVEERRREPNGTTGARDFVLALLFDASAGGLGLLPTHRVLRDVGGGVALLAAARELFRVVPMKDRGELVATIDGATVPGGEWGTGSIGLWTGDGGALLRVDRRRTAGLLPQGGSAALRGLDVSALSVAVERLVGQSVPALAAEGRMVYTKDPHHAIDLVDSGQADACFLLAPTPIEAVLAVAAAGEQMPEKSTYFYPKAPTGLVFNPLAE